MNQIFFRVRGFRPKHYVSSRTVAGHFDPAQKLVNGFEQSSATNRVRAPRASQMPFIGSAGDEFSQRLLLKGGSVAIAEPLARGKRWHQRLRCDQITDSERGKNCARERP